MCVHKSLFNAQSIKATLSGQHDLAPFNALVPHIPTHRGTHFSSLAFLDG